MGKLIAFIQKYLHIIVFMILLILGFYFIYQSTNYPRFAIAHATSTITAPINRLSYNIIWILRKD